MDNRDRDNRDNRDNKFGNSELTFPKSGGLDSSGGSIEALPSQLTINYLPSSSDKGTKNKINKYIENNFDTGKGLSERPLSGTIVDIGYLFNPFDIKRSKEEMSEATRIALFIEREKNRQVQQQHSEGSKKGK